MNWPTDELNPVIHWSDINFGQSYTIGKGEKFAQLVLAETPKVSFYRVDKVADIGEDRGGGFGSTGLV
jgi:dUTP pyrophosphatase